MNGLLASTTRRLFRKIPRSKRKTMTFDNGKEFAGQHEAMEISEKEIDNAAAWIENKPRKCLNYRTFHEVLWSGKNCCVSG